MPEALQIVLWTASAPLRFPAAVDKRMEQPTNIQGADISLDPGMAQQMPSPQAVVRAVKRNNIVITFKSSQWLFY